MCIAGDNAYAVGLGDCLSRLLRVFALSAAVGAALRHKQILVSYETVYSRSAVFPLFSLNHSGIALRRIVTIVTTFR